MPVDCQRSTSGGKGNFGMFIERDKNICAAGLPTAQPDDKVSDSLEHYLLKDEVDALIHDSIIPPKPPRPLPPLRKPIPHDTRFAGPFCDMAKLINPRNKTKFETLVEDFKETAYKSYWKAPLGQVQDPAPMLPEGFDKQGTTFGKKTPFHGRLYDIVMPREPYPDKTPESKKAGVQYKYKYCEPAYNGDLTYGHRTYVDKRGTYARCCVTDDRVKLGTGGRTIINTVQANFQDAKQPRIGTVLAPNDNILNVPKGYSFGILKPPDNLPECLTFCQLNSGREFFKKCLKHLNSLRKCLSKRFLPTFFRTFYLNLKYFDQEKSGWLPKQVVYDYCGTKLIRFDPALIEPLLDMWRAFDNSTNRIEYKTFVHVLNYREPSPEIPKIPDLPADCLDFRTTYTEMVKPGKPPDLTPMAGLPSGRYFDLDFPISPERCCRADRTCLPHESDMKSCLSPSVLTLLHVNHRDMYAKREPDVVRRVFEAAGEKFTDEGFNAIWEEAKKHHSQGWVCFETFRRTLEANPNRGEAKNDESS
ncbi:EF-hand domain-containing family member B [Ostrinia furnacalis]|uniref:EF-hand domain-containing family member B n=1 Tax=Ostrinia furnacalis TaxID=93504 RepID=UPI00103DAFF8|nr:EF-hand domain-containing family member B [Ostrinia furnacalis]